MLRDSTTASGVRMVRLARPTTVAVLERNCIDPRFNVSSAVGACHFFDGEYWLVLGGFEVQRMQHFRLRTSRQHGNCHRYG
ncbi:MAG: hypothetical protein VX745_11600 [Pseudomonadota bacterium]|nr:hypothetical protein [Pseudomonadota bacterium]